LQKQFADTRAAKDQPAIMVDTGGEEDAIHDRG
jgi:hypothetical protein